MKEQATHSEVRMILNRSGSGTKCYNLARDMALFSERRSPLRWPSPSFKQSYQGPVCKEVMVSELILTRKHLVKNTQLSSGD
jgi:hypothetical protein